MDNLLKFTDRKISYLFNVERSIKKLISIQKPVIVDIGGNIGQTCKMFKNIFPTSIIHTIEPNHSSFLRLKKNTKKFKLINYYNYALGSDKKKFIYLNESNNQSSSSLIPFNLNSNSLKRKYHPKDKLNLVKNLKKIVHTKNSNFFFNKLIKVDFCKIDTQGFEYNILKNLNDNNFKKIKVFQIKFMLDDIYKYNSQDNFSKIINLLIKKKFKIFDISNIFKTIKDSRTLWIDCIFVNTKYYNL